MYAWLWDHLPGRRPVKALIAVILVAAVVVALFAWVFPWVNARLPIDNTQAGAVAPAPVTGGER